MKEEFLKGLKQGASLVGFMFPFLLIALIFAFANK